MKNFLECPACHSGDLYNDNDIEYVCENCDYVIKFMKVGTCTSLFIQPFYGDE